MALQKFLKKEVSLTEAQLKEIDREVKRTEQTSQRKRKGSSVCNNVRFFGTNEIKLPPKLTRIRYFLIQ